MASVHPSSSFMHLGGYSAQQKHKSLLEFLADNVHVCRRGLTNEKQYGVLSVHFTWIT